MAIGIVISVLIFNPLIVGIRRFFSKEMNESTKIKEIAFAFDNSYKNIIKIMFFKDLYVFLWTLVLIIPGIIIIDIPSTSKKAPKIIIINNITTCLCCLPLNKNLYFFIILPIYMHSLCLYASVCINATIFFAVSFLSYCLVVSESEST